MPPRRPEGEAPAQHAPAHRGSQGRVPALQPNEIANIVVACFGRRPDVRSVKQVLYGGSLPLKLERRLPSLPRGRGGSQRAQEERPSWSCGAGLECEGHRRLSEIARAAVYRTSRGSIEEGESASQDKPSEAAPGVTARWILAGH